jgi:hypothetical protein
MVPNTNSFNTSIKPLTANPPLLYRSRPDAEYTNTVGIGGGKESLPKMLWGRPTWNLLHAISEKIQPDKFIEIRLPLLMLIMSICSNLPCPTCATHAKDYLTKRRFYTIQTKDELKEFFFEFHNYVNIRKHYEVLQRSELDNIYSNANMGGIIQSFLKAFTQKSKNIRLLADDLNRKYIVESATKFFKKYLMYFDGPVTVLP